jgi:hypothetical protein
MNRLSMALLFLFSLLPAYGSSSEYCTPNYSVAPVPNTQSGNFNSTSEVCIEVDNDGPLVFNCSNMQGRTVTVNGTPYSSSACAGSVTVPNTNDGQYCVTGSDNWKVTMTYPNQETMIATWNIIASWPQSNVLVATPSGSGNNWGVTIKPNGNWTWPTVTCEALAEPSRVHVNVSVCQTFPDEHPSNQCNVAPGYALVGGGAYAEYTGAGALLTGSWPEFTDGGTRWWVASSQDHMQTNSHTLSIYSIGLRLDGVNTARLNSRISLNSVAFPPVPGGSSRPAGALGIGSMILGGGAYTSTSGAGQLLTRTMANGNAWEVASKDHLMRSPGWVSATTLTLADGIIEGFGALEVRQRKAEPTTVGTGVGTSIGHVTPGWALVSLGGEATTTSGPGRMLFRIGVDESGRTVTV